MCNHCKILTNPTQTFPCYQKKPLPLLETIFLQNNFTQNLSKLFLYRLCHIAHDHLVILITGIYILHTESTKDVYTATSFSSFLSCPCWDQHGQEFIMSQSVFPIYMGFLPCPVRSVLPCIFHMKNIIYKILLL